MTAGKFRKGDLTRRGQVVGSWQHPLDRVVDCPPSDEFEGFRSWCRTIDNMLS
ncbi:hypothetical protein [Kribbella karoonensis]|uniref:Uncharacterized protein n=1 Tax=Kribbella karoonensis TaxID=324851 RepID=A0ABP4PV27_9ACTN